MSDTNGSRNLLSNVSLGMIIQIVTIIAFGAGSWFVMTDRIDNNTAATRDLKTQVAALETRVSALDMRVDMRLDAIERAAVKLEAQVESLKDTMIELRRQGVLRPKTEP